MFKENTDVTLAYKYTYCTIMWPIYFCVKLHLRSNSLCSTERKLVCSLMTIKTITVETIMGVWQANPT